MKYVKSLTYLAVAVSLLSGQSSNAESSSFTEALKEGEVNLSLRARYESVDQEGVAEDASALTNRTRLSFKSKSFGHWSLGLELDDVQAVVEDYNSTVNGKTDHPVVADPEGTDLNQAKLSYKNGSFSSVIGRQRVNIGNQRFVGGVGWRQNEQTYDALLFSNKFSESFTASLALIENVNRIFGPTGPASDVRGSHQLLAANYQVNPNHKLLFTGLTIDPDETAFSGIASTTMAIDYDGKSDNLNWHIGFATQSDSGDNLVDYSADYQNLELNYKFDGFSLGVGYESLGSDSGNMAFQTPLATLHKFQGFADKFLVTPANGVVDQYIKIGGKLGNFNLKAFYHTLEAEYGNGEYGTELDLVAAYPIDKNYSLLFKYAAYSGDSNATGAFAADVDKLWIMFSANY